MSRSSLYLGILLLVLVAFLPAPRGSRNVYIRPLIISAFVASAFTLLAARGMEVVVSEYRSLSVDRIFDLSLDDRLNLFSQTLNYVSDRITFGGKADALEAGTIQTVPHNFFINGLLYAGLLGGLLALLVFLNIVYCLFRGVYTAGTPAHNPDLGFMKQAAGLCLFGYLMKGMVHNDSFVIGGATGWILWGIWVVADNLEREGYAR